MHLSSCSSKCIRCDRRNPGGDFKTGHSAPLVENENIGSSKKAWIKGFYYLPYLIFDSAYILSEVK